MTDFRFNRWPLAALAAGTLAVSAARADVIVSSVPVWNGSDTTGINFGTPANASMGETFTNTPGYAGLTGFTFYVKNNTANAFQLTAAVYAWNGTSTTGSALFTSSPITVNGNDISAGFQALTVSTGIVPLLASGKYLALATVNGSTPGISASWAQAGGAGSSFFGGQYVYTNTAVSTGSSWAVASAVSAFTMSFQPANATVPEPSTLPLVALASALTFVGHRMRRRTAAPAPAASLQA